MGQGEEQAVVSITEAAHRLGVSERTIYRMLKAGKLHRANLSDSTSNGSVQKVALPTRIVHFSVSDTTDSMSDKGSEFLMERMRAELAEKDAQIARLVENQKRMEENVQRLQEQMFELARLVLTQNVGVLRPNASDTASGEASKESSEIKTGVLAWLAQFRKNKTGDQ